MKGSSINTTCVDFHTITLCLEYRRYYMDGAVVSKFKSSTTYGCATRGDRIKDSIPPSSLFVFNYISLLHRNERKRNA